MRLKIKLEVNNLVLPLSYKHIIQGTIYNMLCRSEIGDFYHNDGYHTDDKKYKLFVFSDLFGEYCIEDTNIIFKNTITFYIGSLDNKFLKSIYDFLLRNDILFINRQKAIVSKLDIFELPYFKEQKEFTIKTLSPLITYTSKDKYFTYYKPSDEEFVKLIRDNISNKCIAYKYPVANIKFDINEVTYERKKIIYFKNTFYQTYQTELKVIVNYDTLKIIYDTGLSAKGSCGFGMIDVK